MRKATKLNKIMKEKYIFVIVILVNAILIASLFSIYASGINVKEKSDIYNKCSNLDLLTTSKCLNEDLRIFYKYNLSNVEKQLSLDELKNQGGVCKNWADYIVDKFIELGSRENKEGKPIIMESKPYKFYVKEVNIQIDNETSHVITIASNSQGFCLFSNANYQCWRFEQ